jgi:hypothetical protein
LTVEKGENRGGKLFAALEKVQLEDKDVTQKGGT